MALLTTAELLTRLKSNAVPGSPLYEQLDALRGDMEGAVKSYCKWPLEANDGVGQGNWSDYYDGKSYQDIVLYKPFVSNLIACYLDMQGFYGQNTDNYTPFATSTQQVIGTNFAFKLTQSGFGKSGTITYLGGAGNSAGLWPSSLFSLWPIGGGGGGISWQPPPAWPAGYGNIKVTYDWGFQPVTPISSLSWSGGIATMTFTLGVVCWPGQGFYITGNQNNAWNGGYSVSSITNGNKTVTFIAQTNPGSDGGGASADFVPRPIKVAIAEAVSMMRNKVIYGGPVTAESLGDYNYSLTILERPQFGDVRQLLGSYRDQSMAIAL